MIRPFTNAATRSLGVVAEIAPSAARGVAWRRTYSSQGTSRISEEVFWRRFNAVQTSSRRLGSGAARSWQSSHVASRPVFRRGFRFSSRRAADQASGEASKEPQGLGARLKKLSREYGWAAVGVYLGLTALDLPFCFLLVRMVGTDTIGKAEHAVVSTVKNMIPESIRAKWSEYWASVKAAEKKELGDDEITEKAEMATWGVEEAQERVNEEASLGTQLALAYAIHKTFIFVRVPLTAAITPKVVKTLRGWGWNIGKRVKK